MRSDSADAQPVHRYVLPPVLVMIALLLIVAAWARPQRGDFAMGTAGTDRVACLPSRAGCMEVNARPHRVTAHVVAAQPPLPAPPSDRALGEPARISGDHDVDRTP